MSAGAPNNLDVIIPKRTYSQSLLLKSDWGPRNRFTMQIVETTIGAAQSASLGARVIRRVAPEDVEITAVEEIENDEAGREGLEAAAISDELSVAYYTVAR